MKIAFALGPSLVLILAPGVLAQSWCAGLFEYPGIGGQGYASAVFDDGAGPRLFVGGRFGVIGGVLSDGIARWDGARFTPADAYEAGYPGKTNALAVLDDGSGSALYAATDFAVERWRGDGWEPVGILPITPPPDGVFALAVFDGELYAGGSFSFAGRRVGLVRWNGSTWGIV